MKVHAAIAATLSDYGVNTLFGVQGDGNMFTIDSHIRDYNGRYISTSNEAGAVLMAFGYAFSTGYVGVATVTHGPGFTNALSALTAAAREHASIVLLTGDTNVFGHTQNIDQATFVLPTGAGFESAGSAKTAHLDFERAIQRSLVEKRPIVFVVPTNMAFGESEYVVGRTPVPIVHQRVRPDVDALDEAVGLIASARRPLILAGVGSVSPEAEASLVALADRLGAPLATTLPAKGLFGGNPYNLGVFGTLSSERAADAILESDCIIGVGASLNRLTGGGDGWPLLQGKRTVRCDISEAALGTHFRADVSIQADGSEFADTVVEWLNEIDFSPTSFRDAYARTGPRPEWANDAVSSTDGTYVDYSDALTYLNRVLPENRSLAIDGGRFSSYVIDLFDVINPRGFASGGRGLGAVGNGFSTSIGIGCALPNAPVVAIIGDGGFMLGGLAEFNTAVRHKVDLIAVICNDGSYGAEYRKLESKDFGTESSMFEWPDFAPVADALGGVGVTVRSRADLELVDKVIATRDRPVLIDLKLDPSALQ